MEWPLSGLRVADLSAGIAGGQDGIKEPGLPAPIRPGASPERLPREG